MWSGEQPRYDVLAIPPAGVTLGRDNLDAADTGMSRRHVRLTVTDGRVVIHDLGGRNGTFVDGEHLIGAGIAIRLPAVVRIGHTICIAVSDVRDYHGVTPARRGKAVVAGSLAASCRMLDDAALAEDHIGLLGSLALGRELAHSYADRVGGERIVCELDVMTGLPLERTIDRARSPRTMIIVLDRPLTLPDQPELLQWLETDIRIVSVARCTDSFKYMEKELIARLVPRAIELPQLRFDELPQTIAIAIAARAPQAKVHASLIEAAMLRVSSMGEERMFRALDRAVAEWLANPARNPQIYNHDLDGYLERDAAMRNCLS